jgi:hypothetical protein
VTTSSGQTGANADETKSLSDAGQAREFTLKDPVTGETRQVSVEVEENSLGLAIHPEGTGVFDGTFAPIVLEFYDGRLRLLIWPNINEREPKIIDLSQAHESQRVIGDG